MTFYVNFLLFYKENCVVLLSFQYTTFGFNRKNNGGENSLR